MVDPLLGNKLRPHQKIGVQFLFDCTMGLRKGFEGNGCILADDMGLGKSIQAIALLWTLLKQGPTGIPAARRAAVVSPSSLVGVSLSRMHARPQPTYQRTRARSYVLQFLIKCQNWTNELKKWLGDKIRVVSIA